MVQRFENKGSRDFSLVETLAVVAILVILLSLSAVAAAYYRDYLKITELDNAARDIYMAAENRAVLLGGSGQLEKALSSGGAQTLAEGGEQQASVYVAKDTAASLGLLTGGAIDPALLNGQFYIVYDTASGAVTDVFYTEGPDIQDIHYALSIAGNRDKRMRPDSGPMLGYYGGEQEARTPYTPLPAPEVLVEVENGDLLKVHVTFSVPDAALSIVGNNWMHTAKQTVQLEYEGAAIPLMNYPALFFPERHSSSVSSAAVTHTWVLDALDRADGVSDRHFYQLFSNSGMTFGGDFTVTAEIELSAPGCRPTSASGSDTGNSLFAQRSGGSAAQLENLRHLQNLDAATSRAGGKTSAVQINDIDCRGTTIKDPLDPYGLYKFASIENLELTSFDAGWTLQDGANRRNEITDLRVTKDSAKVSGAGLFAKTADGMTFTGVRLMDAGITGSQNTAAAGALVGSAGSGSTFRDIRAVNVKAVCPNGPAGGIAGSVAGSSGKQNENLFSDCRVYWEPEEGQDNLRSLLGSDQKSNPYQYGEILHGTNAGGLAGELSGKSGTTAISKSLAASLISGTIAGGLVGNAQHTVNVDTSYADCYLKGETYAAGLVGKCKDGGTSKGSALTNVYAAGFIDCADMGFGSKAAGLFNVSGTVSGANVYTAVSYLNQTGKVTVNPGVPDNSPDLANRCYYLDPTAASTGAQPTANGAVSYDDMSTEGLFDKAIPGKAPFYQLSLLAVDPGDSAASPKTISKLSTLSTAHDQGGEVTRFGYGVYNKPGHAITLGKNTPYPLLYSEVGEAGGDFDQQKFSTLEAEKKTAAPSSTAYLNKQVDEALAEQMYYRVGERFQFHSFHSYGLDGGLGGLYPNSGPAVPNGTLTLSQGGNQNIEVTFALNPLFAEALAVELPKDGKNWSAASKDVPQFTSSKNNWTGAWTLSGDTPGSSKTYPYGVRSIAQLQFIDWNSVNRDTNTVLKLAEKGAQGIASFPYLSSGSTTGNYYWTQSYDIKGERTADGTYKTYSPIAEYYDTTNTNENRGYLDGWFGGVYDGNSYVIENVSIQGRMAPPPGTISPFNSKTRRLSQRSKPSRP